MELCSSSPEKGYGLSWRKLIANMIRGVGSIEKDMSLMAFREDSGENRFLAVHREFNFRRSTGEQRTRWRRRIHCLVIKGHRGHQLGGHLGGGHLVRAVEGGGVNNLAAIIGTGSAQVLVTGHMLVVIDVHNSLSSSASP